MTNKRHGSDVLLLLLFLLILLVWIIPSPFALFLALGKALGIAFALFAVTFAILTPNMGVLVLQLSKLALFVIALILVAPAATREGTGEGTHLSVWHLCLAAVIGLSFLDLHNEVFTHITVTCME